MSAALLAQRSGRVHTSRRIENVALTASIGIASLGNNGPAPNSGSAYAREAVAHR